jgi:hypothetical protein
MTPFPDRIHFSIAFPSAPEPVVDVWRVIAGVLLARGHLPQRFEVSQIAGHEEKYHSTERLILAPAEIEDLIIKRKLDGFSIDTGHSAASVAFMLQTEKRLGGHGVLNCRIEKQAKAPEDWNNLIEGLMTLNPSIGAWQWRHLYQVWQWASEVIPSYEFRFGSIPTGYQRTEKAITTSLTPQPPRVFLDISKNPGRPKELIPMVHFYPTAEMWLGPSFWQYAKCTKEEALAADFFIEKRDTSHYLYLKCWPEPFTRPDGEQGRMQQRLWKLFFHEDCEWPPGSGTISDEPMYGPPELMPG